MINDPGNDSCSDGSPPNSPSSLSQHGLSKPELSPLRNNQHQHHSHHHHHHHHQLTHDHVGSSGSDLDVDSTPDMDTPENLSVKRDDSGRAGSPADNVAARSPPLDNLSLLRHYSKDYHNSFMRASSKKSPDESPPRRASLSPPPLSLPPPQPSSHHHHHHKSGSPQSSQQRSPIDLLLRVFPTQKRAEVEGLLQRNRGNILQTMESLIYGDDSSNAIG